MRKFTILIWGCIFCTATFSQVKVNPNGKFFNYNGTKIYYEDTGNGEPLLLLHNFFNTADCWKPYVETYSKQFRTIAVDMIGHGRSDLFYKKDDLNYKHADYTKIILALLDSLKLYKVNAIGASSGGTTLLHLNIMQPERFKSVITIGGHLYYSKYCRDWIVKTGMNNFMEWTKYHGPEKQVYLSMVMWESRKLYGDPSFTPDMLNTIMAKWLVVNGDNDEPVPFQIIALEMHKSIPNSRLWIVPNGGHLPHLIPGFKPEFLRVSLEFLNGSWDKND